MWEWMCVPGIAPHLFSFSRRWSVRCSSSLSWQSRWTSRWPWGESWSRAGLEWRRRYWSSSLSPPTQETVHTEHISRATQQQTQTHTHRAERAHEQQVHKPTAHNAADAYLHRTHARIYYVNYGWHTVEYTGTRQNTPLSIKQIAAWMPNKRRSNKHTKRTQ